MESKELLMWIYNPAAVHLSVFAGIPYLISSSFLSDVLDFPSATSTFETLSGKYPKRVCDVLLKYGPADNQTLRTLTSHRDKYCRRVFSPRYRNRHPPQQCQSGEFLTQLNSNVKMPWGG